MTTAAGSNSDSDAMSAVQAVGLLEAVAARPTLLNITQASRRISEIKSCLGRVSIKLACISTFTFDPLRPVLELAGARAGFDLQSYVAPYGQFDVELIDPQSNLAGFGPDVILAAVRLADVCPDVYDRFNTLSAADVESQIHGWLDRLSSAFRSFRQRSDAHILVQNSELPVRPALGIADRGDIGGQLHAIHSSNARLHELASSISNCHVMDYDALVARVGREAWCDERMRLFARIPVASAHYWRLAAFYVQHMRPLYGLGKKALILDADNTLWGGVVGDAGVHGIELGSDFPGNAYVEFQKKVLDLHRRGVVLAIASKNEPGAVERVLREHAEMVLKPEHFASMRVNWNPKPQSLREIADELNLGIDSFVFIDDSPVECDLMRMSLPEVLTIQLSSDPAGHPAVIDRLDCFEQWTVSQEDRERGQMYRAESERREMRSAAIDMESFYRQLDMRMTVSVNRTTHVARASQMTHRTNQFNMHTRRQSEDDIRNLMADGRHEVATVALCDKFGDNGIIGMAVVRRDSAEWTLEQFLMSCRVLGRTVETTFLRWIAMRARSAGAERLAAEFVATAKNKPFSGFYAQCGLSRRDSTGDIQIWELELGGIEESLPEWMRLVVQTD